MKILENAEINEHGQAVLSADEYADVCREVARLTAEVERLRGALENIRKHQSFVGCSMSNYSAVYNMANKALTGED